MLMRKKIFVSLLISLLTIFKLAAQTTNKIIGLVKTEGKAVHSATVILFRSGDSSLVKTAITDTKGSYEFEQIKNGKYYITVSFTGYEKNSTPVFSLNKAGDDFTVPPILLKISSKNMQGVTVTSSYTKPMIEVTAGKTVFNIENSINATGSNAFELLQKSPGVVTDKDDNITVKGKNGVRIYIDGRPTQLSNDDLPAYLRSINSADIESIEIISNPSSKYDASGNAGVINIKLKKNKKAGFNGSVSLGLNYGKSFKTPEALSLNYRNKKVNLFSNYSTNWGNRQSNLFLYREQSDSSFNQVNQQNIKGWSHNIKAGADFFLTKKSTVGFIATVNLNNNTNITSGNTIISPLDSPGVIGIIKKPYNILYASNTIPGNVKNIDYNFNYRYADSANHELDIDADYGYYKNDKTSSQPNYYYNAIPDTFLYDKIYWDHTNTNIDIYTAKLDYETPFKKGKLGFGGKISYVTTTNNFDFYNVTNNYPSSTIFIPVIDSSQTNYFNYRENINALYVNYNTSINKKWIVQGGVRMENTSSTGQLSRLDTLTTPDDNVKRNYTDFFPSAAVTYTVNDNNTFNLSFSSRIDRPSYQDLNPFEIKLDELTYQKGNAFLLPQYTNSVELTHTFKSKFNTTLSYSHVKDFSARIIDTTQKSHSYITQVNLASQDLFNINFSLPFQVNKWWNIYANINAYHSSYKGILDSGKINVNLAILSYSLYMEQTFTLGHNYTGEITGYYDGPSVWAGTFKSSPLGGVDIGMQKKLFHNKIDIKLSCTDLFNTMHWRGISNYNGVYTNASGNWESHLIKFNFTYHFGNLQFKQATQRHTGSEDENKRINSTEGLGGN
jgi:iron complex outermembrane receptor protein